MSDKTFGMTEADIQKAESRASKLNDGNVPKGSEAAMMQSILDKSSKDKADIIAERQANLPLPDDPPGPSDFNSADARNVNISSSDVATGDLSSSDGALREPATGESAFRADAADLKTNVQGASAGREGAENLSGLPNDAVSQGKKNKDGLADTTNQDAAANRAAGQ